MKKGAMIFWIGILVLVVAAVGASLFIKPGPSNLEPFAQCLKDEGATFYGAFWCPHCQRQKALFGSAASKLPYVECSTPDGQGQLQVCIDKEITNYPTWEFADGSRLTGERSLAELAEKTSCQLPSGGSAPEEIEEGGTSNATS
jgi:thiol-disulfide isomerase/thioredoxin